MSMHSPTSTTTSNNRETVGAFVVTFRRPVQLVETIRAVQAQTRLPDMVVVINNDPACDIRTVLGSSEDVTIVNMRENSGSAGGFGKALNIAHRHGLTWAWLLDDDSIPYPDTLQNLLEFRGMLNPQSAPTGILAPLQESSRGLFGVAKWGERVLSVSAALLNGRDPFEVDLAYWAGMLVHQRAIEIVGFPRAEFFVCFADFEYCLRVRAAGLQVVAVPMSRLWHEPGSTTAVARLRRSSVRTYYPPLRSYYHSRNVAFTARYVLRSPRAMFFHIVHEFRKSLGDLLYSDRKLRRVHMRMLGLADGFRGRLGRREDLG